MWFVMTCDHIKCIDFLSGDDLRSQLDWQESILSLLQPCKLLSLYAAAQSNLKHGVGGCSFGGGASHMHRLLGKIENP